MLSQSLALLSIAISSTQGAGFYYDVPHIPTTFYSYKNDVYSMFYCYYDPNDIKTGVATNYPQLNPNAKIEDNVYHLLPRIEQQVAEDLQVFFGQRAHFVYKRMTMDLPEKYWNYHALTCAQPNKRDSMIYHIRANGAVFQNEETVLHRIKYDYNNEKVELSLCTFNATNSTLKSFDIQKETKSIPFAQFGQKTFADYGISMLLSTAQPIADVDGFMGNATLEASVLTFMDDTNASVGALQVEAVPAASYQTGDAIPFQFFVFNDTDPSDGQHLRELKFNVFDLSTIAAGGSIVSETYHDICQSSANYNGDYEAALNFDDWTSVLYNDKKALTNLCREVWSTANSTGLNLDESKNLLIADNGRAAYLCDQKFKIFNAPGSHNSSYNDFNVSHAMCLDYVATSGFDEPSDLTQEYCSSLSPTASMQRCYERLIRYVEEGTALEEAIVRRDNAKALLDAVMLALHQMEVDGVPGFVPITQQLLHFILRTSS